MTGVVIDIGRKFHFFRAVSLKNRVVNDESISSFVQIRDSTVSPIILAESSVVKRIQLMWVAFLRIDRVFSVRRCIAGTHVQKQAAVAEYQAEQAALDGYDGVQTLFVCI